MRPSVSDATRLFIFLFFGVFAVVKTLAQPTSVLQAPPPITFGQWRAVGETVSSNVYSISFPSAIASTAEANNVVHVRIHVPKQSFGPAPCTVLLHYWGAANTKLEDRLSEMLADRGIASAIVTLPYHMQRTPLGYASGELAIRPDIAELRQTMIQSISDVRRTLDFLDTRSEFEHGKYGVSGTSLGSIVATLLYAVEPRISCGVFTLSGVDIAQILWNSSRVVNHRESLRRKGYTEEKLRAELVDIEPLTYLKPDLGKRSLVVRAVHDTVIPGANALKLIAALNEPQVIELDTGHFGGVLVETQVLRQTANFFAAELRNARYKAPMSFYAPTIRVGLMLNEATGLQVAAGVDLWRSNKKGDGFASVFLTPRGVQGFLGIRVSQGLAVGIGVTRKRTTASALWSIVL